jgi:3-hydroxyisobutyrate dehydrogenase
MMQRRTLSVSSDSCNVAFIGLGNMGLPMAVNLMKKAQNQILVFDTSKAARESAAAKGLTLAESTEEIASSNCELVFTMLPNDKAVHGTMTSLQNVAPSSSRSDKPRMIIDCSTVSPSTSRYWHEQWKAHDGSVFMDAPVSGGVKGATEGTLTFMVGCEGSAVPEIAQNNLEVMGKRVVVCGGPGTGAATKLCNNLALAAQMIGICEAMSLGEALSVDPVVLAEVMNTSTAKCWSSDVCNPHPAVAMSKASQGTVSPAYNNYEGGFGTKLMLKDLGLAVAAAEAAGVAVPLAASSKELYRIAVLNGLGEKDFGVMYQFLKGRK